MSTQHSTLFDYLVDIPRQKHAGYMILVDPDRQSGETASRIAHEAQHSGVDIVLVGSSLLVEEIMDECIHALRQETDLPIIIFPGGATQVSRFADAILFMSLLSGRNPNFLIGEQVRAAPLVQRYRLEAIPTAYILVDGGSYTSVAYMSDTHPIPRDKPDITWAHALAAQYMGMRLIYLEAGSGAELTVPTEMVRIVRERVELPVIVGGGIRTPEQAAELVSAGAQFIVTGSVFENGYEQGHMKRFADAIHSPHEK